jgi:hypothetical protein
MSIKPTPNLSFFNTIQNNSNTLIKSKSQSYSISLPIININKEIVYSGAVFLRNIGSKIAEIFSTTIEHLKQLNIEEAAKCLVDSKYMLEGVINAHLDFLKVIDLYGIDDSIFDFVKQFSSINRSRMLFFTLMLISDINETLDKLKNKEINFGDLYAIRESLMFYRPVNLTDDRFVDDIIQLNN